MASRWGSGTGRDNDETPVDEPRMRVAAVVRMERRRERERCHGG